jgi:hypothetical protein
MALPLAACRAAPEPPGARIVTAEDLVAALGEAGIEVAQTAQQPSWPDLPGGRVVLLGQESVEIYEEGSEATRASRIERLLAHLPSSTSPHLWGRGRIIVAYEGSDGPTLAVLSGLLGDSVNLAAPAPDEPYPPAVVAAISWLAQQLGSDPGAVEVVDFEQAEWPDACLGLPAEDEACAEVITPGWSVTLSAADDLYVVRTNELGTVVRPEP